MTAAYVDVRVPYDFGMLLSLDEIRNDGVGWLATFVGKPSTHGNRFSVPVRDDVAAQMKPGREYLFVLAEERP